MKKKAAKKVTPSTAAHRKQMQAVQAKMRKRMRAATQTKGLIIVHTGDGKGKTTAAFGMVARMLGHKRNCAVIQFIKSGGDPVERLLRSPRLHWHRVGDGFTWDTQNRAADIARCREGWALAQQYLADPEIDLLLLDELNVVLSFDYLPRKKVLAALRKKRGHQHVVITGRDAHPELIELADLATEMQEIKHPFNVGIKAQPGIEF